MKREWKMKKMNKKSISKTGMKNKLNKKIYVKKK